MEPDPVDRPQDDAADPVPSGPPRWDWRSGGAWAGRLAFPTLVLGVLLGMRAAQHLRPPERDATTGYAFLVGCVVAIAAGLWMLRARHRYLARRA